MKKIIAVLSILLIIPVLCGCLLSSDFRDVNKISTIDFSFSDETAGYEHYLFDLDGGVFRARLDKESLEDSPAYELEQSEIDTIRNSFEPARKWSSDYKHKPLVDLEYGPADPTYRIVIEYSDGTSSVLNGSSKHGEKWPDGFVEIKSTLDDIANARIYEEIDPAAKESELTALMSEYDPQVNRSTDNGYEWLDDDGYSISVRDGDGKVMYVDYNEGKFTLDYRNWKTDYDLCRMDYEDLLRDIVKILNSKVVFIVVRSNGEVLSLWTASDSECSRDELISAVRRLKSEHQTIDEKTAEYGYQIEGKCFDKTKGFVYTVEPEG